MNETFQVVDKPADLPQVPCCVVNLGLDLIAARMYAAQTGRQVYYIREREMAVWFQPLRRQSDGATA